jgi:hypothetical protein
MAISLMVEGKKGISANQMKRHLGVTYKTAWYVCHRIREAMQEEKTVKMGGPDITVEIDETLVGGRRRLRGYKNMRTSKATVLGLAERGGQIHMERIKSANLVNLRRVVGERLDPQTPKVITDGNHLYQGVIPKKKHEAGNHKEELKTKNWTSTRTVENAFSLFKRGIVGNDHQLGPQHLDRYLGEFCWRYNRRHQQPQLFDMAMHNLANKKPLPYKDLIF